MSFTCELSGELLTSTTKETVVVTPSGHIGIKRLILLKLTENGGLDPFETIRQRPLSEDQLIELKLSTTSSSDVPPPPRPSVTSFPNLLQMMQTEYDALVLELFDTRKALEDTRRELSQALYQNDAAIRVVARLSMERDTARQELEQWNASVGTVPTTTTTNGTPAEASEGLVEEPETKRRKVEQPEGPLTNDVPEEDCNAMLQTWENLHPNRKALLKAAALQAPTTEALASYSATKPSTKNWHKSSCRGILTMAKDGNHLVTAGKDSQVVVYSIDEEVVKQTFSVGSGNLPNCISILEDLVVIGTTKGKIVVYSIKDGTTLASLTVGDSVVIVDIKIHPTGKHLCFVTSDGSVVIGRLVVNEGTLSLVSTFRAEGDDVEYTCGAVHPDGLLYAAGTKTGAIHMWDFKNKVLASTLKVRVKNPKGITSLVDLLFIDHYLMTDVVH